MGVLVEASVILVVGGTRGGGKVCVELLEERVPENVVSVGRGDPLPVEVPSAIAFYQRDRENEFEAGVETTRRIVRHYVAQGMHDAALVLIGSTAIHEDDGSSSEYRLAKSAMLALMKKYAQEFRPQRIRSNMVSPGDFRKGPMTAADVAEVVLLLIGHRFITGQEIIVRA